MPLFDRRDIIMTGRGMKDIGIDAVLFERVSNKESIVDIIFEV